MALLQKMTCNLRHPMSLHHPVLSHPPSLLLTLFLSFFLSHKHAYTHTHALHAFQAQPLDWTAHVPLGHERELSRSQLEQKRELQRWDVCCSVLQCVAVCCSVLQCVAVCCCVLHEVEVLNPNQVANFTSSMCEAV